MTEDRPGSRGEELERQADEAQKKLVDAERRAEETLEHAAAELRVLTEEQEATAERLRRERREASPE